MVERWKLKGAKLGCPPMALRLHQVSCKSVSLFNVTQNTHTIAVSSACLSAFCTWPGVLICAQTQGYQNHRQYYNAALGRLQ